MSELRKAAETALEALRNAEIVKMEQLEAMYALQEALAQTGQAEERQERREHLVSRCDMSIEDLKSEIDFILGHTKREWVGISEKEVAWLWFSMGNREGINGYDFAKAIEAKLKERNT
jgi:hypothetical protein